MNVWKDKRGTKRIAHKISEAVNSRIQDAESVLGANRMKWLRDKNRSHEAFKLETMFYNLGLSRWYDVVYRSQSTIAHAQDALYQIYPDEEPMEFDAQLGADIERAAEPLYRANSICLQAAEVINARFCLGMDEIIEDLGEEALVLLQREQTNNFARMV